MLQALLASAGLTVGRHHDPATIRTSARASRCSRARSTRPRAFRNNEPVQLAQSGFATTQLTVDSIVPLPGPGLIVGTGHAHGQARRASQRFIAATLRAMDEIEANPQLGLDDSIAVVPELGSDRAGQLAMLNATIALWSSSR